MLLGILASDIKKGLNRLVFLHKDDGNSELVLQRTNSIVGWVPGTMYMGVRFGYQYWYCVLLVLSLMGWIVLHHNLHSLLSLEYQGISPLLQRGILRRTIVRSSSTPVLIKVVD
jgi:integral membrane sensor domain MASE1